MVLSTPFPPEEGIGYYVYNLSRNLSKKGHKVTVITRGSLRIEIDLIDGIKIIRVPFIPIYPFYIIIHGFLVNKLFKSIETEFDLVHIHTPLSPIIRTSLPIVSTIHTSLIEDARHLEIVDLRSIIYKISTKYVSYPLVSRLIKHSEVVTTVSNSVAHELQKYYGFANAIVVGNGVEERIFTPAKNNIGENYILYVGRLSYRKGLFDLLDCAKHICHNYSISFFLVGKGELEGRLRERIKDKELQDKVILLGHVNREELIQLYQNAKTFVLPSHYEGLPTVLLEAMSCGLPVVSTSVSGCVEVVEHMYNGLLIPARSPKRMSEAISLLLEDHKLNMKLGENARKTIEERFTWEKITREIIEIYNKLI